MKIQSLAKRPPDPQFWGNMNFRSPQNWGVGFKKAGRYLIASPLVRLENLTFPQSPSTPYVI